MIYLSLTVAWEVVDVEDALVVLAVVEVVLASVVDVEVLDVLVVVVGLVGLNVSSFNSVGNDVDGTNDGWEEGSVDILGMKLG